MATAEIRRGELWRLITDIFPHADLLHLGFNLYWTWIFGTIIEQALGHFKTAALFVLFALGASSLEFAFERGGVGLSGVGYGLFGFLWIASRHDERFRDAVDNRTVMLFLVWFLFCIGTTITNIMPVANIAHGGGLILGILAGAVVTSPKHRILAACGIAFVVVLGLWGATVGRPRVNISRKAGYEEAAWGYVALVANRNAEAVRWFHDAATYQPNDATLWFDLGIAYQRLGKTKEAAAAYARAHELEPNNPDYSFSTDQTR